ncbi:uncharacterized protein LOC132558507 isoform X2 [Ylistrum balloti]|uniref:uncharacterized protein LOC132558507 isoform X2 n=1 Tax=Ylistrum balloti TaxID=509963 RepID=UPI0029058683|nr:uncharacterized protein LOC132558507 isoform X2 [Ylistrum balloti]
MLFLFFFQDLYSSYKVRLYGNKTKYEGGIEIFYRNQLTWNPLCGGCWSNQSANVACKDLGFRGGIQANVLLDRPGVLTHYFDCPSGTETSLSYCHFETSRACNFCTKAAGVLCAVDGGWGHWSSFGQCSVTCGKGQKSRTRSCDRPKPLNGGKTCRGNNTIVKSCQENECPIDGGWGHWSSFGQCSVTCGKGQKSRTRSCDRPKPQNGGKTCRGNNTIVKSCQENECSSTIIAVTAACVMVVIVTICIVWATRRCARGGANDDTNIEILQVKYENGVSASTNEDGPNPNHSSPGSDGIAVHTDNCGYGILSRSSRLPVGIPDDDLYSHTKSGQLDGEYDVFVRNKDNPDASGIYDHVRNVMVDDGQYDVFQGRDTSRVKNNESVYDVATNDLP